MDRINYAVLPVAGRGTRLEPATRSIPKALTPLANHCMLDYAVVEARAAGIDAFALIVAPHDKSAFERWLGGCDALDGATAQVIVQPEPRGVGAAVAAARDAIPPGEAFAVLTPDDVILDAQTATLARMIEARRALETDAMVVAIQRVPWEQTRRYGVLDAPEPDATGLTRARGMVEKPDPAQAPSRLTAVGRYLLPWRILEMLDDLAPGAGGEIHLTDAMARLMADAPLYGFAFPGRRLDCGEPVGYVLAQAACALAREDLAAATRAGLESLLDGES